MLNCIVNQHDYEDFQSVNPYDTDWHTDWHSDWHRDWHRDWIGSVLHVHST